MYTLEKPGKLEKKKITLNTSFSYLAEEDVGDRGLVLWLGGKQLTWRWKSKCLVKKCLLGQAEPMGCRDISDL